MDAPDSTDAEAVIVVADDTDADIGPDADHAALARALAEITAMQRSPSITNEDFAAALRTCHDVLDSTLAAVQARIAAPAQASGGEPVSAQET